MAKMKKEGNTTKSKPKKSTQLFKEGELAERKLYQTLLEKINNEERLSSTELKQFEKIKRKLGLESESSQSPDVFLSSVEVCEYLGVSKRMLHYYIRKGQIRENTQGTFDKDELDRFIKERAGVGSPEIELKKAELRYRKAKADREEIIVNQLQEGLIETEVIEKMFAERTYELTRSLLYLSRRVGPKVAAMTKRELKEVTQIIDAEVYAFLERYSRIISLGKGENGSNKMPD